MSAINHAHRYLIGFGIGVIATLSFLGGMRVLEFFFDGDPVVCQDSFPRYHTACIYSRFGIGDQAITFKIDGVSVFFSADLPGGGLKERVTWDSSGRFVTFHVDGLGDQKYDAELKILAK
jgi:hypothetical protein